ncbi:hypothetical protein JVT61DRAFT_13759 [Boletus reticuloceps]|uniref:G domain-containing protein n=1 Tax=Boletus reticuloceps TaxID=495285 RepID=A0A8I3AAL1_9AGAM|nr:hypothetical protein JVT61DRAFT_13759 [Boletus reticuloceps]
MDSSESLTQIVDKIDGDCTKFRILLLGKAGCGKSSLLNKVFGIEAAIVSHQVPRSADVEREVTSPQNSRFILHDSQGFLPNSESEFNIVKDFIQERMNKPKLKDKLHAVWICMSTPHGGERLDQTSVGKIFDLTYNKLPLIIVLTKFDLLVATTLSNMGDKDVDELWADSRVKATHELNEILKYVPHNLRQLMVTVSTSPKFEDTIPTLIKLFCAEVQRFPGIRMYNQPASLMWSIAQRGDVDTTIAATINIGRKRYWSGLGSGINFATKTLEECLSTIHADIVTVWNIQDSSNYLAGDDFKARMTHLVDDLASVNPNNSCAAPTPTNIVANLADATVHPIGIAIAVIGAADEAAKWVCDVYDGAPQNIACVMGYIVDLTIIMRLLSISHWSTTYTSGAIEEETVDAIREHVSSGNHSKVHNKIRKIASEKNMLWFVDGRDIVLEEIVHLIQEFCDISQLPTVSSEYDLSHRSSTNAAQKYGENDLQDILQEGQLETAVSQEYNIVTKYGAVYLECIDSTKSTNMSTMEAAVTTSMRHAVANVRNEEDPGSQVGFRLHAVTTGTECSLRCLSDSIHPADQRASADAAPIQRRALRRNGLWQKLSCQPRHGLGS